MPVQPNMQQASQREAAAAAAGALPGTAQAPVVAAGVERGGPSGPEPTRYGDWERAGRCIDF